MIYLHLTPQMVIVGRVGRVWLLLPPLDVGGVLAMPVYSILRVDLLPIAYRGPSYSFRTLYVVM